MKKIIVCYEVIMDDHQWNHLQKTGLELGNCFNDAGPELIAKRTLMGLGLEAFSDGGHGVTMNILPSPKT